MGFKITVQTSQQVFEAEPDESILSAALRQGLTLPYGCRDGVCGACRGRILSGSVDHGKAQDSALSAADLQAGSALFCCAKARSDLIIESSNACPVPGFPVRTLPARVQKLTLLAPDVMLVDLKLPSTEKLQYLAGQYINILLQDGQKRSFSLATPTHSENTLQLHIRNVPGGQFTEHVFNSMKERDILRLNGPHGSFYLREDSDKPMLLIAGGTGFAPIKAIVEYSIAQHLTRPMTIYWGGRTRSDLYLLPIAARWANEHKNIHFVPVLSEPQENENWRGRTGFVHSAAMQDFHDLSSYQVYVGGSPAMVAISRQDFVGQCNLPEDEFFADSFEFSLKPLNALNYSPQISG